MVVAYHLILSAYGFWLPNDPRGSWSDFVYAYELYRFAPATKVNDDRSHAYDAHDRRKRLKAKKYLERKPVIFNGLQARAIARGFAHFVERSGIIVHACAIMPDHVHLVVARHRYAIEYISRLLKGAATNELIAEGIHPFREESYGDRRCPPEWARGEWSVFIDNEDQLRAAIRYVNKNPTRDGLKAQHWNFVTPHVA
jgi:REP element-mobilizing transposase RayT